MINDKSFATYKIIVKQKVKIGDVAPRFVLTPRMHAISKPPQSVPSPTGGGLGWGSTFGDSIKLHWKGLDQFNPRKQKKPTINEAPLQYVESDPISSRPYFFYKTLMTKQKK